MSSTSNFSSTEIRAGLFVLVAIAVAAAFALALGLRPTESNQTYYAYFEDTVGLNLGAEVRFGGVKVGTVTKVSPAPDRQSMIEVEARVLASTPVNEASESYISQVTLTAQKHFAISTGTDAAPLLPDGGTIPKGGGDLFTVLAGAAGDIQELLGDVKRLIGTSDDAGNPLPASEFGNVGDLMLTLDSFVTDLRVLVGAREIEGATPPDAAGAMDITTVAAILDDVKAASSSGKELIDSLKQFLDDNSDDIALALDKGIDIEDELKTLLESVNVFFDENDEKLADAIESAQSILETIDVTATDLAPKLEDFAVSLEAILADTQTITGGAATLLDDNAPTIEAILADVREMMRDLKVFAQTLADEPQAIIRGKSPSGRQ